MAEIRKSAGTADGSGICSETHALTILVLGCTGLLCYVQPCSHRSPEAPLFSDGLGDRVVAADGATGDLLRSCGCGPR